MRRLVQLFEILRTDGYVVTMPGHMYKDGAHRWIEAMPSDLEWELFAKCEPFVFTDREPFDQSDNAKVATMSWKDGYDENQNLDAPFPVFSIEYLSGGALDFFKMNNGERRETICILAIEILPKQYGYYALTRDEGDPRQEFKVFKSNMEGATVEKVLQRLNAEKMGVENVRHSVKMGTGKQKRFHRIRRIIHVAPKKYVEHESGNTRHVDWTHRFEVRGHWRKHEGLGKDREGLYCIHGFTWVSHHTRGPEHLPLVKKTRLVE